jgi:hypothetical protein
MAQTLNRTMLMGLAVAPVAALLAWMLYPGAADTEPQDTAPPLTLNTAAFTAEADNDAPVTQPAIAPLSTEPLGRLRIARQSFSRGGLGSKALMTFTVRNRNDYAVKDLDLLCKFRSKDGSYATERRRILRETVDSRSRKVFPQTLVGFVNVRASKAKCTLLAAARV